jgi:Uma2 family endonuclease
MVQVALKPLTFAEFLVWDDGTGGEYQVQQFRDNELVRSSTFPDLDLTAAQIFMMAK